MGKIRRLSVELANQIAAGEVVERPSSVVKELVENALDANATRVAIDVEQGGMTLVRVTDDGDGMADDDAVLCLERHATSKISKLDDLSAIGTFGFRGEALPSIASVSRLLLRTRLRDRDEGVEVGVDGGAPPVWKPAGGATGTTIEVRDLFFNVPARRKFLKATATESAHVSDVVLGAALARPDVTFVTQRDGRVVREHLRCHTRAERAQSVFGGEKLVECRGERGPLRIEAMLAPPERARAGATGLSLLVNGRPVRDRMLARAVSQAYGSVLEGGRYPVGAVWLDMPADMIDVNVHPQKAEVRFRDSRFVFDAITRELHTNLARAFGLPALTPGFAPIRSTPTLRALEQVRPPVPEIRAEPLPEANLFMPDPSEAPTLRPQLFEGAGVYAKLRYVGQVHATYLVCEGEDGLYVLDQHAAAERVTFDRLRRAHASRAIAMQRLLVPEIVELAPSEVALIEENADDVGALGVEARRVGEGAIAVHGMPAILARAEPARVVRDLVAEVSRSAGRPFGGAVDLVLATMACHGSIRAGDAVSEKEAKALLAALDEVDFGGHCPHGRPIVMRMAWGDLGRRVGR
jgi:DNA mismatch repair protein MutL